jgi:hypothetical protein
MFRNETVRGLDETKKNYKKYIVINDRQIDARAQLMPFQLVAKLNSSLTQPHHC